MMNEGTHEQNVRRVCLQLVDSTNEAALVGVEAVLRERLKGIGKKGEFYSAEEAATSISKQLLHRDLSRSDQIPLKAVLNEFCDSVGHSLSSPRSSMPYGYTVRRRFRFSRLLLGILDHGSVTLIGWRNSLACMEELTNAGLRPPIMFKCSFFHRS